MKKSNQYKTKETSGVKKEEAIKGYMSDRETVTIFSYDILDSTNTKARELAEKGEKEFTTVIANEQTNGRGRLGRSFYSPANTGLYMSIILRPSLPPEKTLYITSAAAVACAEAIEEVCALKTEIKWVNDILSNGKKISGILAEGSFNEKGGLEYVILGIGVNIFKPEKPFPDEIKDIAHWASTEENKDIKSRLTAKILDNFISYYKDIENKRFIKIYKDRLCWLGKKISIISGSDIRHATLLGIGESFELEVELEDKTTALITSGEVSIRRHTND